MKKHKLYLISNMYPSKTNPFVGTFVKNFKLGLEKSGQFDFPIYSVIRGQTTSTLSKGLRYIVFAFGIFSNTFFNHSEFDYYYVHYINHSLLPFLIIKRWVKKPVVLNAHGGDILPTTTINKFIQKLTSPILYKADLIVVPSPYFKDLLSQKFKIHNDKIFVSPSSGINNNTFYPLEKGQQHQFKIGFIGRFIKGKGWETLLHALNNIRNQFEFSAEFVASGVAHEEFLQLRKELALEALVSVNAAVSQPTLNKFYNSFDIFVFPSEKESLGLVGLEAMACKVPVIGSNIQGITSYLRDGYNGLLFEPGNHIELSQKIMQYFLMSSSEKELMQENAYQTSMPYREEKVMESLANKLQATFNQLDK